MKKMEKQLLISVIVPVYNVKEYLSKCLETIINQTYNKLEIILIDDGSNDGSGKICDVYEKKDSRIKVIHKVNGGLSSARNDGIATANGAYIIFIDSDDYIEKTMIMDLYESAIKNNSDIVCCGKYIHKNGNVRKVNSGPEFSIGKDEALRKMLLYDDIDNHQDYFWVYIEGKMNDTMVQDEQIIESHHDTFVEYWKFIRYGDDILLDEIKQQDEVES